MTESFEPNLLALLEGHPASANIDDNVDSEDARVSERIKLICKKTISYIVAGVVFNDEGKVLLVQEAKASCRGAWYLPAGRMEPEENFEEAVTREVQEESGLLFNPTAILCVEAHCMWYRVTYLGEITGGTLKTLAESDSESLQAQWYDIDQLQLPLRANDILKLISLAKQVRSNQLKLDRMLIVNSPQTKVKTRAVILFREGTRIEILISENKSAIPTTENIDGVNENFRYILLNCTQSGSTAQLLGVLAVEHCASTRGSTDGIALTLLATVTEKKPKNDYKFVAIENDRLRSFLLNKLDNGGSIILHSSY